MNFKEYLANAWSARPEEAKLIASELKNNFSLMQSEDDVMAMAGLIVHVCGEQLGEWQNGSDLLKKLKNNATIKDKAQMNRLVAILNLGNNPNSSIENFSASDQAVIFSTTAAALANLGGSKNSEKLLKKSAEICPELDKQDPAYQAQGMAAKKIVTILQNKKERSASDEQLMSFAASLA